MRISAFFFEQAADPFQLSAPEEVRAALGGSISVSCRYNQRYSDNTKYWCKGKTYELCTIVVKTPRNRQSNRNFITDNRQRGFFTVTMTFLEEHDEDMYWCVIARFGRNIYAGVRVRVSHAVATSSPTTMNSSAPVTQDEICGWWAGLRWSLFIIMSCCLILTHVFSWRITTSATVLMEEFQSQISSVYD